MPPSAPTRLHRLACIAAAAAALVTSAEAATLPGTVSYASGPAFISNNAARTYGLVVADDLVLPATGANVWLRLNGVDAVFPGDVDILLSFNGTSGTTQVAPLSIVVRDGVARTLKGDYAFGDDFTGSFGGGVLAPGDYRPAEDFSSAFNGRSIRGVWVMQILDSLGSGGSSTGPVGLIASWELGFNAYRPGDSLAPVPLPGAGALAAAAIGLLGLVRGRARRSAQPASGGART